MRVRTHSRKRPKGGGQGWYLVYLLGRTLQVTGLLTGLLAATAFFGTPDTVAMLRTLLAAVLFFLPGWWLVRRAGQSQQ